MLYDPNAYITNHVNISLSRKILRTTIQFSKRLMNLIKILHATGVIKNYLIFGKKRRFIRFSILFYKGKPFFTGIKLISTLSKKFYISLNALKKLHTVSASTFYILSTSRGIITHQHALKLGIGGLLLCMLG